MRILVVDDSDDARSLLEAALHEGGLRQVWSVDGARKAFQYLGVDPPGCAALVDLIFMDIMMPEIDGLTAIRRIRQVERLLDVPIIVVTANGEEQVLEAAFAAGAVDFIVKPIRVREVIARAQAALRIKRERDVRSRRERGLRRTTERLVAVSKNLQCENRTDPLTGIANRRALAIALHEAWRGVGAVSLLMIDVDNFHEYNEQYGHLAGDACLQEIAAVLRASAGRAGDCVARYGGDELVVLLPGTPAEGAATVAEAIRSRVERLDRGVTVSVGVATLAPNRELPAETIVAAADEALYLAKERGRNQAASSRPIPDEAAG